MGLFPRASFLRSVPKEMYKKNKIHLDKKNELILREMGLKKRIDLKERKL